MAAEKLKQVVQKLKELRPAKWAKKPWEITGPCSSPEYVEGLPNALEYRPFAPATAPVLPRIPNSEEDRVFNITYFTRDTRRMPHDRHKYVLTKQELEGGNKDLVFKFAELGSNPICPHVVDPDNEPGGGYQK
ncbi:hypothetical protein SUGI_0012540 [Cryptomeria japonica]|uniref:uncharacterized protein LOC131041985 n=1 Tax=Cryptomeria japonica TaxID=3369 RepID=UPI0024089D9C|nr:uncharacterized protein LOC131041985 [Cryptomeria japonica]GLJ05167.1 hypothetical protein SUGI_0012540 [Cryptomeria japonica]